MKKFVLDKVEPKEVLYESELKQNAKMNVWTCPNVVVYVYIYIFLFKRTKIVSKYK